MGDIWESVKFRILAILLFIVLFIIAFLFAFGYLG